jgi:hypothetical protein
MFPSLKNALKNKNLEWIKLLMEKVGMVDGLYKEIDNDHQLMQVKIRTIY